MISVFSESIFLLDAEGHQVSFDLDAWRRELDGAFEACGFRGEYWRTENLVLCLEEKARLDTQNGAPLTEADIIRLLTTMLNGTGYGEVAEAFLSNHQRQPTMTDGKYQSWNEESAAKLLLQRLPITQAEANDLASLCLDSLHKCGLRECSENFLQELGVLLLHAREESSQLSAGTTVTTAASGIQYISPQIWQERIGSRQEFATALQDDTFRLLPLSDIFPAARLELRLDKFCQNHLDGWAEELPLLTALPPFLDTANNLLLAMRDIITDQWPRFTHPARHLIFPGFHKHFKRRKKAAARLSEGICEQLSRYPDIIVSFS